MSNRYLITFLLGFLLLSACSKGHVKKEKVRETSAPDKMIAGKEHDGDAAIDSLGADGAVAVIQRYYTAINKHEYGRAYELWGNDGAASNQTLASFKNGYLNTDTVEVIIGKPGRIEGAAGSRYIEIPVTLKAVTNKGAVQHFAGHYVLRRTVVDGSTPEQRRWHLYSAHLSQENKQHL